MKIAVMGYGTIGSGVVEVLDINREVIAQRAGEPVEVAYVLDLREFPGSPVEDRLVKDYKQIAQDPEVGVVVETMGGVEPAFTFVREMLEAGKHVTTSNKNLVAAKGAELLAIAKEHGVSFQFEASVGGGIPIIRPLQRCLTADVIEEITGILNGTTNYMLTKMSQDGAEFDEVLRDAQEKGYAEKDPTADIEGFDPCRKIAILTSLVCGHRVDYEDIHTEGITGITAADFKYAKVLNRSIKLLASSRKNGDTYSCMVAPFLLAAEHPLAGVSDVFNAIFVRGNVLGDAMFYGSGAGKLPTASAVVADVVDMIRIGKSPQTIWWSADKQVLCDVREQRHAFFVRTGSSAPEIEAAFGKTEYVNAGIPGELAFLTEELGEAEFAERVKRLALIGRIRLA